MVLHVFTSFLGGVLLCIPYGLYSGTSLGGTMWRTMGEYPGRVLSQNIINNGTCTNVRRILICSSIRYACTWKIVFKIQNNELNELSECMFYKMFHFSENISKL